MFLVIPRNVMDCIAGFAFAERKLELLNLQHCHRPIAWTADVNPDTNKPAEQTFHCDKAREIVAAYLACIAHDGFTNVFSVVDMSKWPWRGIIDSGPNLQHILAVFWFLAEAMKLARKFFLPWTGPESFDRLPQVLLELNIRLRAIAVFGETGFPNYGHFILHVADQHRALGRWWSQF